MAATRWFDHYNLYSAMNEPLSSTAAVTTLALLTLLSPTLGKEVQAKFEMKAGTRQLFLDDHGIEEMAHLERTMHRPVKHGAVIRSTKSGQAIQTRAAPMWDVDEKKFKLWVLGIDQTFWTSMDGLHWTPGATPNRRTDLAVYDPADPDPSRRFKAALPNEGFAISPDGVTWTKTETPMIPSSDESNLSYDPNHGRFIHTVKRGGKYGRSVAVATSTDFEKWDDLGVVFQTDKVDQELGRKNIEERLADKTLQQPFEVDPKAYNVDIYNMGTFHYEGLYLGMPALYHSTGPVPNYPNTDGFHLVQLVMSRDLKDWKRLGNRQPFIGPSRRDSGAYDLTQILPPSAPVVRGDELWFYYTGLKYRASFNYVGEFPNGEYVPKEGLEGDAGAICLAVLRRDGFISLDAGEKEGRITTKRFRLSGTKLFVNANARRGRLIVEVLDEESKVIARSVPIEADAPHAEVMWATGGLEALKSGDANLRFTLSDASLYSYWFE
jgi:hypothetical protein